MASSDPPIARRPLALLLHAIAGPHVEERGIPIAGIATLPDGTYVAHVSGWITGHIGRELPRRGRKSEDAERIRRYAATLAEWIDAENNPTLTGKKAARIAAARALGKGGADDDVERAMRRDEGKVNPRPVLEFVVQSGRQTQVLLFFAPPRTEVDGGLLKIRGDGWRYDAGTRQCVFGELDCSAQLDTHDLDRSPLLQRIRSGESTVVCISGLVPAE